MIQATQISSEQLLEVLTFVLTYTLGFIGFVFIVAFMATSEKK